MVKDPEYVKEKWKKRLKQAVEDIRKGVEDVTESPMEKAIKKKDKFIKRLMEAIESGKWEAGLKKVSLDEWKEAMTEIGVGRISGGVERADEKMREFFDWLMKNIDEVKREVDKMPDTTLEERIARMEKFVREMAKRRYKK